MASGFFSGEATTDKLPTVYANFEICPAYPQLQTTPFATLRASTQPDLRFERTASIFKKILRGNLVKCHLRMAALGVDWMGMSPLELHC